MTYVDVNDFNHEVEVVYKGEVYSVRDNGAIMRHTPNGERPRPKDNIWTFGNKNEKTGYMLWVSCRVHIIVCLAFNGEMPEPGMVVDHIDTNRCNNRPENLRWLTRLENALNNPITRAKIEIICGSIEAFIADPSILRGHERIDPNFKWMRAVTHQEAKNSYDHFIQWANDPNRKKPIGEGVGDWIFQKPVQGSRFTNAPTTINYKTNKSDDSKAIPSLTANAVQIKWFTPTEFLCCPSNGSLIEYFNNLAPDKEFCRNRYGEQIIVDFAKSDDDSTIWVMTSQSDVVKPYYIAEVTFDGKQFIHKNMGSFLERKGAEKRFTIAQGKDWTGEDGIDDFC